MRILPFTYRKTNYFLMVGDHGDTVAFDAGWPCTYLEYARAMKQTGFSIEQVKYVMVSHFHMDHAGLVGALQQHDKVCLVFEGQTETIDDMEQTILKKQPDYVRIDKSKLMAIETKDSRRWLAGIGIQGEIISTPGHSNDSVSFVADGGEALIGDHHAEDLEYSQESQASWQLLRSKGAQRIFPAHGPSYDL